MPRRTLFALQKKFFPVIDVGKVLRLDKISSQGKGSFGFEMQILGTPEKGVGSKNRVKGSNGQKWGYRRQNVTFVQNLLDLFRFLNLSLFHNF